MMFYYTNAYMKWIYDLLYDINDDLMILLYILVEILWYF